MNQQEIESLFLIRLQNEKIMTDCSSLARNPDADLNIAQNIGSMFAMLEIIAKNQTIITNILLKAEGCET